MFNPFEILQLEQSYFLEPEILEKHYFQEQKRTHPDQFFKASAAEKDKALKKSVLVNQAYLILKNPLLRAECLLKLAGITILSNDPAFLEKLMSWNELIERGENVEPKLLEEEAQNFRELEIGFSLKDYEKARRALYQLTYIQKLLKQSGGKIIKKEKNRG